MINIVRNLTSNYGVQINLVITRGLKKLGYGRHLSVSRYRMRKGLPGPPSASGKLTDEPDWCYIDGTPGQLTKGQTRRYLRDQEFGRTMVKFNKQFEAIEQMRQKRIVESQSIEKLEGAQAKSTKH